MRTVRISSIRGENLIPQDGNSCDPYVSVRFGEFHVAQTERISCNHTSPVWRELDSLRFHWDGVSALPTLEFTVYDHDVIGSDDCIGFARVGLHRSILNDREIRVQLGIRNEGDRKLLNQHGTLGSLMFTLAVDAGSSTPPAAKSFATPSLPTTLHVDQVPSTNAPMGFTPLPSARGDGTYVTNRTVFSAVTNDRHSDVALHTLCVRGLPVPDGSRVVVAVVVSATEEFRTPIYLLQGGSATWTDLNVDVSKAVGQHLQFVVLTQQNNEYKIVSQAETVLYNASLNNESTVSCPNSRTSISYATRKNDRRASTVSGRPTMDDFLRGEVQPGKILFHVVGADNLLPLDYDSAPDALVIARFTSPPAELFRTAVCKDSIRPVWNELHEITCPVEGSTTLRLTVADEDPHGFDFAGQCLIDFAQVEPRGSRKLLLTGRHENTELALQDSETLKRFQRSDFGTIQVEWVRGTLPDRGDTTVTQWNPMARTSNTAAGFDSNGGVFVATRSRSRGAGNPPLQGGLPQTGSIGHQQQHSNVPQHAAHQNGSMLSVTVLSVANLAVPLVPYARVMFNGESKDNSRDGMALAKAGECLVWNFKTDFFLPAKIPTGQSGITFELCDARTHTAVGSAAFHLPPSYQQRATTVVVPLLSSGTTSSHNNATSNTTIGELTFILSIHDLLLPQNVPLSSSAMLELTVLSAKGLLPSNKPNNYLHTNPYVIVTVHSGRDKVKKEFRSETVFHSRSPRWYFSLPTRIVSPSDVIVVAVWDHDDDDFDEFLGSTRFSVGSLLQSPAVVDLPLEGRDVVASDPAMTEGLGSISVQWSVTQAPSTSSDPNADPTSVTPHIVEIAVIDASDLALSRFDTATVQVSLDERASLSRSQSFTKVVPKLRAHWNETFQINSVGNDTTVRFTVWDEATENRGATFLGECVLRTASLAQASQHSEVLTLALRPRQDPRYAKDDLVMLNQSPKGLGALRVEARIFTMQEYEKRHREALRAQGKSYQLVAQVAGSADITQFGNYFVTVGAGGEEQTSSMESGTNVRFRSNFTFELHNPTEMVTLALFQRMEGERDYLLGDVAFPVKPPSSSDYQAPDEAWLTLRRPTAEPSRAIVPQQRGTMSSPPAPPPQNPLPAPRLLIRWRTFPSREPQGHVPRITSDSIDAAVASRNVETLQREILKAKEEIALLRDQSSSMSNNVGIPSLNTSREENALYTAPPMMNYSTSSAAPLRVQIFVALTGRMISFQGTQSSRVADACRFAVTNGLGPSDASRLGSDVLHSLKLFLKNELLADHELLARVVGPQDILLLQPSLTDSWQHPGPSYSTPNGLNRTPRPEGAGHTMSYSPAPVRAPTGPWQQNQEVMSRIREQAESRRVALTSVILSSALSMQHPEVNQLIALASHSGLSGFCFPNDQSTPTPNRSELFVQGPPHEVLSLLMQSQRGDIAFEEVVGFVPRVIGALKCARGPTDLSTMFLHCSGGSGSAGGTDGSTSSWIVHAQPPIPPAAGVRYVDERGFA